MDAGGSLGGKILYMGWNNLRSGDFAQQRLGVSRFFVEPPVSSGLLFC
jgi:hypothetical protein